MSKLKVDLKIAGDLFANPETSATVLHALILNAYGDDVYGDPEEGIPPMDPIELWASIDEDFRTRIHENNENKLNALVMAVSSDAFYFDPQVFVAVCMALYDGDLGDMVSGVMEDLTLPEILWGIYEVELNRDDQPEFAPSVARLIDAAIASEAEERDESITSVLPYYENIVEDKRMDLFSELKAIGVDDVTIRRLSMEDVTPRHNDQGVLV